MKKNRTKMHLKEYTRELLERRKKEIAKHDIINEFNSKNGLGLTSPTTSTTTEETRLLMEYIDRANLFNIAKQDEKRGKFLKLRKFFKSKQNQQVEIYYKNGTQSLYKEGKVSTVGRDFVMLTNLKERTWIPYQTISSANIPTGIPNYSNSHQHYLFDNNLRWKLVHQFGDTVARRETLKQQFYEESLETNLDSWKNTWIAVYLDETTRKIGKIKQVNNKTLYISDKGKCIPMNLADVQYIQTIRLFTLFKNVFHNPRKI